MPVHPPPPPLTTAEVAQLLGVKPATVYAYVSRGLLGSRRNGDGKNSLFDRREVDAFLAARKRPTTPGIRTGITLISDGTLHYRGHDAIALASVASFEEIVALLWTGTRRYETLAPDPRLLRLAEDVIAPLPGTARHTDRLRLIVAAAAAGDPLRFDTTPAAVIATSRALLGTMVAALPPVAGEAVGARGKPRSKGSAIEGLTSGGSELLFRDEMRTGLAESSGQEAVSDSGGPQATTAETGLGQAGVPDSEDGSADVASAGGGHAGTNGTSSTHTSTGDTSNTHTSTGDTSNTHTSTNGTSNTHAGTGDTSNTHASTNGMSSMHASTNGTSNTHTSTGDTSNTHTSTGDTSNTHTSTGDTSNTHTSTGDTSNTHTSTGDTSNTHTSTGDTSNTDTGTGDTRDAHSGAEDTQARLPHVVGDLGRPQPVGGRIAEALWGRLTGWEATPREHNLLDAALILLADHDIAASTLAARVAASTRAHPYAVVGAGLAALDGPLHGAASSLAFPLLAGVLEKPNPIDAIAERLRAGEPVPGFGHRLYPDGDPRARALLDMLGDTRARDAAERLSEVMRARSGVRPNVDLALAALTLEYGMPPDAGETIFAVARTAGWIAHALEEYADRPSRFRPSGDYAGQVPG